MPGPDITAQEAADELGRGLSWVYENYLRLQRDRGMPTPLHASPL